MAGALIEIVAVGVQDVYLIGNAQITYWKVVYRRHTNFAVESSEQTLNNARFGAQGNCTVVRNGDLAAGCALKIELKAVAKTSLAAGQRVAWTRRLGHALTSEVKVDIGGTTIDTHVSVWLDLWYELTHTDEQERGYRNLIGDVDALTKPVLKENVVGDNALPAYTLYVPLQFWFNRNTGLALPLIALQYHEVRFNVTFASLASCLVWDAGADGTASMPALGNDFTSASVLVDYVFLDSDERRKFAQVGHEYLIEQVQSNSGGDTVTTGPNKFTLNFNHPCKELVWAVRQGDYNGANSATFDCYAHDGDWKTALDNFAKALVESAIYYDDPGVTGVTAVTTDVLHGTDAKLLVTLPTGGDVYAYDSGVSDAVAFYSDGTTDLWDKITFAAVVADDDGSELTKVHCTEVTHTLSMSDLSGASSAWTQTGRNTDSSSYDASTHHAPPLRAQLVGNYGLNLDGSGNPVTNAKLLLNNHARFSSDGQDGNYFNFYQTRCHTRTPADGVNVFSFALHPENHQPSGSANLSRIDSVVLQLTISTSINVTGSLVHIFAVNYNVLRIMSGMGGLAYSN